MSKSSKSTTKPIWSIKQDNTPITIENIKQMIDAMPELSDPNEYIFSCAPGTEDRYRKMLGDTYNGKPIRYINPPEW